MTDNVNGDAVITDEQIIEHLKVNDPLTVNLEKKFKEFINNLDVLKDDSRLERATNALDKPNLEERIGSQLDTLVTREFRANAAEAAEADGVDYVPVTKKSIDDEVERRKKKRLADIKKKQDLKVRNARTSIVASTE